MPQPTASDDRQLRIPGPTPLPPEVRAALSMPMIGHRSKEFASLLREVTEGLARVFETSGDVLTLTCSGTGGLEAALASSTCPGDKVIVMSIGVFGNRVAEMGRDLGRNVILVEAEPGHAADPEALSGVLECNPDTRVVFATHNETSTGVQNDVAALAAALRTGTSGWPEPPLFMVDAVSSLGAVRLPMDELGVDIVVTASQKALMVPPGLAFVAVRTGAWERLEATSRRSLVKAYYLSLVRARKSLASWENPWTPSVALLVALRASLQLMFREGLEAVWARHEQMMHVTRTGLRQAGFRLVAPDECASRTVTAAYVPEGISDRELRSTLASVFGVRVAGGQGALRGRVIRVAHMGFAAPLDMVAAVSAVEGAVELVRRGSGKLGDRGPEGCGRLGDATTAALEGLVG